MPAKPDAGQHDGNSDAGRSQRLWKRWPGNTPPKGFHDLSQGRPRRVGFDSEFKLAVKGLVERTSHAAVVGFFIVAADCSGLGEILGATGAFGEVNLQCLRGIGVKGVKR